jgi:tetratricopeptide (TPR) repeat protein
MLQDAIEACDRALRVDPKSEDGLYNRAIALEKLDRVPEAIAAYHKYLAVDDSSPWSEEVKHHLEDLHPEP